MGQRGRPTFDPRAFVAEVGETLVVRVGIVHLVLEVEVV